MRATAASGGRSQRGRKAPLWTGARTTVHRCQQDQTSHARRLHPPSIAEALAESAAVAAHGWLDDTHAILRPRRLPEKSTEARVRPPLGRGGRRRRSRRGSQPGRMRKMLRQSLAHDGTDLIVGHRSRKQDDAETTDGRHRRWNVNGSRRPHLIIRPNRPHRRFRRSRRRPARACGPRLHLRHAPRAPQ